MNVLANCQTLLRFEFLGGEDYARINGFSNAVYRLLRWSRAGLFALVLGIALFASAEGDAELTRVVVFVCEHGSAKSVVAASHFNRLAAARGLAVRAVARGTLPDAELPAGVVAGLGRDRCDPVTWLPTKLETREVAEALRIVAFLDLASDLDPDHRAHRWNVPAVSADYEVSRAAIVRQVEALLDELAADRND